MIYEGRAICGHVNDRTHWDLPRGSINIFQILRDFRDFLYGTIGHFNLRANGVVPKIETLEILDQVGIDLKEVTRECLPLEQIGYLWLNALVTTRNGSNGCRKYQSGRSVS